MDKCLVAREQSVTTSEQIAFEPALAGVLAQYLHHPTVCRQMLILRDGRLHPSPVGYLEQGAETIGGSLIRPEYTKVSLSHIALHHVAQELSHHARRLPRHAPGPWHVHRIVAKVRQAQVL